MQRDRSIWKQFPWFFISLDVELNIGVVPCGESKTSLHKARSLVYLSDDGIE
jgi:hypothetical protein